MFQIIETYSNRGDAQATWNMPNLHSSKLS